MVKTAPPATGRMLRKSSSRRCLEVRTIAWLGRRPQKGDRRAHHGSARQSRRCRPRETPSPETTRAPAAAPRRHTLHFRCCDLGPSGGPAAVVRRHCQAHWPEPLLLRHQRLGPRFLSHRFLPHRPRLAASVTASSPLPLGGMRGIEPGRPMQWWHSWRHT